MVRIIELERVYADMELPLPADLQELFAKMLTDKKLDNSAKRKAIWKNVYYRLISARKISKGTTAVFPSEFKNVVREIFPGDTANHDVKVFCHQTRCRIRIFENNSTVISRSITLLFIAEAVSTTQCVAE